jgi:hypothetical protein
MFSAVRHSVFVSPQGHCLAVLSGSKSVLIVSHHRRTNKEHPPSHFLQFLQGSY